MLNIVIFGAPGSGKGTQSEKIVEKLEHGNLDMVALALPFDTRGLKVAEIL